jgi:hypothetical protein
VSDIETCEFGRMYSLKYTQIPKSSSSHITGDDVRRTIKEIRNVTLMSNVAVMSKVVVAVMLSEVFVTTV